MEHAIGNNNFSDPFLMMLLYQKINPTCYPLGQIKHILSDTTSPCEACTGRKADERPECSGKADKLYLQLHRKHVHCELHGYPHHEIGKKDRQVYLPQIASRPVHHAP